VNVLGPVEADEATLPTDGPGVVLKLPNVPALLVEGKKYGLAIEVSRADAAGNVVERFERKLSFTCNGTFQDALD
jgi:hypothetical protein